MPPVATSDESVGVSQASVSRCIRAVSAAIVAVGTDNGWVQFPTTPEDKAATKREFLRRGGTDGVVGCVDGTLVAITKPKDLNPGETQGFWARKGYYALNVMIVSTNLLKVKKKISGSVNCGRENYLCDHYARREISLGSFLRPHSVCFFRRDRAKEKQTGKMRRSQKCGTVITLAL